MFHDGDTPTLALHGSETNGVLRFSVDFIQRHRARIPHADELLRASLALIRILDLIKAHPWKMPPERNQDANKSHIRDICF